MHSLYSALNGIDAVAELWQHTASDYTSVDESLCIRDMYTRDKGILIIKVAIQSLYIRKECQLLCSHRLGYGTGCIIRIDIVALILIIHTYGTHYRKEILIDQIKEDLGIDSRDLPNKAYILAVRISLLYFEQAAVLTG